MEPSHGQEHVQDGAKLRRMDENRSGRGMGERGGWSDYRHEGGPADATQGVDSKWGEARGRGADRGHFHPGRKRGGLGGTSIGFQDGFQPGQFHSGPPPGAHHSWNGPPGSWDGRGQYYPDPAGEVFDSMPMGRGMPHDPTATTDIGMESRRGGRRGSQGSHWGGRGRPRPGPGPEIGAGVVPQRPPFRPIMDDGRQMQPMGGDNFPDFEGMVRPWGGTPGDMGFPNRQFPNALNFGGGPPHGGMGFPPGMDLGGPMALPLPSGMPGMFFGGPPLMDQGMMIDHMGMGMRGIGGGGATGRAPSRGEQNDYSQHFVDTGQRPQNFIRDLDLSDRFEEYPKLKELLVRKDKLIAERAAPPMYLQADLRTTELSPELFGTKFDVILIDPPWEEYVLRAPGVADSLDWWTPEDIMNLRIEAIADTPSFIFLWVGDGEGLDHGRLCLKKWGFRRCEDICWIKTNRSNPKSSLHSAGNLLFQHSKEHCLMGIRGTVRRSSDGHVIHANIDTDVIISEEAPYGSTKKPEEMYSVMEHFAQGGRRLELFGEDHNIRAGWLTVGNSLSSSNFNAQTYCKSFASPDGKIWQGSGRSIPPLDAPHLVGTTPEIEALRPKSPPNRGNQVQASITSASQPQASASKSPSIVLLGSSQGKINFAQGSGGHQGAAPIGAGKPAGSAGIGRGGALGLAPSSAQQHKSLPPGAKAGGGVGKADASPNATLEIRNDASA